MNRPSLPTCGFFGPHEPDDEDEEDDEDGLEEEQVPSLPADWTGNPFDYLPGEYVLSDEERELAERYRQGDISGGYLRSQIASFRAPQPPAAHERRRENLQAVRSLVAAGPLALPDSFLKLAENDCFVDRIRHNSIWFRIHPELVELPEAPDCRLLQSFVEGQGCDHWSLLLIPGGAHFVCYHSESLGSETGWPPGMEPDRVRCEFFECAASFDEWLTVYFLDCRQHDRQYAEMLAKFPEM